MNRPFTPAWLAGEAAATALLERGFADSNARAAAVAVARSRPIGAAVIAALKAQEAVRPQSEARAANLERLANGAAAVVTGQQVGLFLGPLYALHKAASAVVDARALEAETGAPVVPVFWLQTEDHDFDEVCSVATPGAAGLVRVSVADELGAEARVPLAERRLGASVAVALERLEVQGPYAAEVNALLARHYVPEATFGDAFAGVLAELFAEEGLVIFDPRAALTRAEVARLAAPVHAFALREAAAIEAAMSARAAAIADAGFEVQVPPRAGCALSCYAGAARHRLERCGAGWTTRALPEPLGAGAIESLLAAHPERFTTTALLRPLLQDTLLPTAAYVGGPGELAYFAQLAPLYELAGRTLPLAVPRARFTLVTATARRLADQLGAAQRLPPGEAVLDVGKLIDGAVKAAPDLEATEQLHASFETALADSLATLEAEALRLGDGGFEKQARKAGEVTRAAFQKLLERSRRHALEVDTVRRERIARFKALLNPEGAPQERVLGFAHFAAQVGGEALVARLVAEARPFDGTARTIDL